jgi:DnaJ-class molecular chaperone
MEYRDYYATLGVPRTASQAEIRKAFRRLAREHHPDVNKGEADAERRFKEVSEANEVLSDPEKRKAYDQLGANWEAYQRAGAAGAAGNPFAGFTGAAGRGSAPGGIRFEFHGDPEDLAGFSDFFRTFFAGGTMGGAAAASPSGWSTRTSEVDPELEPLFGGIGGDFGAGYASSGFGTGSARGRRVDRASARADAAATTSVTLEEVMTGTERVLQVGSKRLEVKVPAGVRDGQRIRLTGKAEGGGDVYLTVTVEPHRTFTRDGANLSRELPLTLGEALLGGKVHVESIAGKRLLLTIPAGTQQGRVFRLSGQGLPRGKGGSRGDLLARTRVVLPTHLDDEGRELAGAFIDHVDQPSPRHDAARSAASNTGRKP